MTPPSDCHDMTELRAAIDTLDAQIVTLLKRRVEYVERAAELKVQTGMPARINSRIEEVVSRVRARAQTEGFDPKLAEDIWRRLIEWSIEREQTLMAAQPHGGDNAGSDK